MDAACPHRCGIVIFAGVIITLIRSAAIGGFLDLVLAIPLFLVTGPLGSIGDVLAMVGGTLSLLSAVRPPQKGVSEAMTAVADKIVGFIERSSWIRGDSSIKDVTTAAGQPCCGGPALFTRGANRH
jgi:hypothetical protein